MDMPRERFCSAPGLLVAAEAKRVSFSDTFVAQAVIACLS